MNFPRIGTYSSLRGDGTPLLGYPDRIAKLAKWDDVIIEVGTLAEFPDIIRDLRANNPAIKLHAYVVMSFWESSVPFFNEFRQIVLDTNGVLLNDQGDYWVYSNVNLARTETMEQLADLIVRYAHGWDGIFIDILIPEFHGQTDIGWDRMGYSSYQEWETAWNTNARLFVQRLKTPGLPVGTNYGNGFPNLAHGNMREAFPTQFGGTWEANMVVNQWNQPGNLNLTFAEPRYAWICSGFKGYDGQTDENKRVHRFGLGSACLSGDLHSFGRYEWDARWCVDRLDFWYPEYQHPVLGKGWLGQPVSDARKVDDFLWVRDFERGAVVVNPTPAAHSIYFSERYRPINGAVKTAFSLKGNDGLFLEKV